MRILVKNIDEIYTLAETECITDGYIIIDDNRIEKVESGSTDKQQFDRVINGAGMIAMPGLINGHTHCGMTFLRGYADDLPLQTWLEEEIWPFEAGLTADDIFWGSQLGMLEMISTGTTTFNDMYFQMHRVGEAVRQSGMRAVLGQGLIEASDGEEGLTKAREFSREWQGKAGGRITTMLAPHAPYTCSTEFLQKVINVADDLALPIHIHIAETAGEREDMIEQYGESPVKYLDKIGLFTRPVVAAHCVHVDEEDRKILQENNAGVVHNPESNMKLSSGIAPVHEMMRDGIKVALGTDGVSSNNNLDLIEEARSASYLQKVKTLNPTVMDIKTMARMLTVYGAEVLGLSNLGCIKQGFLADIILIDVDENPHYYPHHNNLSNLLYAGRGSDVDTVIIDGRVVMKNGEVLTIDREQVYYEIENRLDRLCSH